MRKQVFGRQFKRDKNERKALFSGLISAMILRGRISTTEQKAKAIKGDLEKLVTKAKKGESAKRELSKSLKPFEVDKMINQIAPVFKDRNGGYTKIIRTGKRFNDNASTVIMEWVEAIPEVKVEKPVKKSTKTETKKPTEKKSSRLSLSRKNASKDKKENKK
jgi:large subunit ribosomal protein L17